MSEFKFNFGTSDDENGSSEEQLSAENIQECDVSTGSEASEIGWTPAHLQPALQSMKTVKHEFGNHTLLTVSSAVVEEYLLHKKTDTCKVIQAISGHSDLVAGQYEGGLKVWECCIDLCNYLVDCDLPVKGSQVLELGCGAGLPGMLASRMGALSVHFQDFNQVVLETYTMKNLVLNDIDNSSCKFFAGDWASFALLAEDQHNSYDIILTSETIYNLSSYPKLLKVFSSLLTNTGVILVAAKSDYFGVGGSVFMFMQAVKASGQFEMETVRQTETGISHIILKLTRT